MLALSAYSRTRASRTRRIGCCRPFVNTTHLLSYTREEHGILFTITGPHSQRAAYTTRRPQKQSSTKAIGSSSTSLDGSAKAPLARSVPFLQPPDQRQTLRMPLTASPWCLKPYRFAFLPPSLTHGAVRITPSDAVTPMINPSIITLIISKRAPATYSTYRRLVRALRRRQTVSDAVSASARQPSRIGPSAPSVPRRDQALCGDGVLPQRPTLIPGLIYAK